MTRSRSKQAQALLETTEDSIAESTEQKITKVCLGSTPIRIRTGANITARHTGQYVKDGIYEIDEIREGIGSKAGWGHLANGAGWIALDFAEIIE